MKRYKFVFVFLSLTFGISVFSQKVFTGNFKEISKIQCGNDVAIPNFVTTKSIKKQSGKLAILLDNGSRKLFTDDHSNTNYKTYEYVGDLKAIHFSLVKMEEFNSEEFYLINRSTGVMDTLIGYPVFSTDTAYFACMNNPGTDEKQYIQIYQVKNGKAKITASLTGKTNVVFEKIKCVRKHFIILKSNKESYWKLSF